MKHPKLNFIPARAPAAATGTVQEAKTVNLKQFIPLLNDADIKGLGEEKTHKLLRELAKLIEVRLDGNLENKGFYLSSIDFDWSIVEDVEGILVLVPQKKS